MDTEVKTPTGTSISFMSVITAVGGFLAFVGVFLDWFDVAGLTGPGTDDWTGVGVAMLGVVVLFAGLAPLVVKEDDAKRTSATVAAIGGFLAILLCAVAFARLNSIYSNADAGAAFGLYVSLVGGLIAAIAGIASRSGG